MEIRPDRCIKHPTTHLFLRLGEQIRKVLPLSSLTLGRQETHAPGRTRVSGYVDVNTRVLRSDGDCH